MSSRKSPIVQIKQGKVQGTIQQNVEGGEFFIFEGIPFAQPPTGELRFKDPLPVKPWNGIRSLESKDVKPVQYDIITEEFSGIEDCLYLNVSTNSLNGKRSVMIWIPGGGFNWGSASPKLFGADYLLKKDIVFVSIDYRLGCFGFLNLDLPEASGNQGIKDIVAGLNWVQENIEAFGGDPGNVTICGESAGGSAVHILTISPVVKGLFHKAIIQSAVAIHSWAFSQNPLKIGLRLAAKLSNRSINDSTEALKILKQATKDQLQKANRKITSRNIELEGVYNFLPSVDRKTYPQSIMPKQPMEMAKSGINVPLIIGSTSEEGLIGIMNPYIEASYQNLNIKFSDVLGRALGISDIERVAKIAKSVKKFYFDDIELLTITNNIDGYTQMLGDLHFYNGIQQVIEIQSKLSTPTYVYQFSYKASYPTLYNSMNNDVKGPGHGDDLGVLFYTSGQKRLQKGTRDYLVMQSLIQMWTNFAKTGNPTPKLDEKLSAKWKPITKNEMNYLNIGNEQVLSVNFREAAWKFWKPILETL